MEVKTCTFYAPCPVLDVEAMQTWLEDMSLEGYLLKGCSKARHKFEFYQIEPLPTRYRLTPVSDKIEEWNLKPNEEFTSITEAFGWEHVCSNIRFHIFRAYSEEAREIHTDPAIQTQAVRQLAWRIAKMALRWVSLPLLYMLIVFAFGGAYNFWRTLIVERASVQITIAYFVIFAVVKATVELVRLSGLYKRMKRGYAPVNRKDWKKKASFHRALFRAYPVLLVVLALLMSMGRIAWRNDVAYQDLPPVGTELPFLSVADMAQQSDIRSAQRLDVGYMRNWSHILSPVNYEWAEIVDVVDADGTEGRVSIQVYYHEAGFSWLAESLTWEYTEKAKQTGTQMREYPRTAADQVYFYYNEYGKPAAVLRYDNSVIQVEFPRADIEEPSLKFEYWIASLDHSFSGR